MCVWNIPAIRRRPTCYTNNDLSLSPVARRSHKNPKLLCTMAEACHVISGANWRQRTHYAGSQHASSRASQITLRHRTPRVTQLPSADLKRSARNQTLTAQPNSERAAERSTRAHEHTHARNHAHTRAHERTREQITKADFCWGPDSSAGSRATRRARIRRICCQERHARGLQNSNVTAYVNSRL